MAMMKPLFPLSLLAAAALAASAVHAQDSASEPKGNKDKNLPAVVVQEKNEAASQVVIDTRSAAGAARQVDGAALLKEIPNMSLMRRGQQSSDPAFRGLGGSRLTVTANDQMLYGGCGIRNDTPTSYINPQSYDELIVTKGPQTVLKGPGLVAGSVEFVRRPRTYERFGTEFNASLTAGSFSYWDGYADLAAGNPLASVRLIATKSRSENIQDFLKYLKFPFHFECPNLQ